MTRSKQQTTKVNKMTRAERTEELILIKKNIKEAYYNAMSHTEDLRNSFTVAEDTLLDYIKETKRLGAEMEDTSQRLK